LEYGRSLAFESIRQNFLKTSMLREVVQKDALLKEAFTMRVLSCLTFLFVVTAAHAQSTTTTVNRETNTVTTTGQGFSATTQQTAKTGTTTTYTTTITKTGGYQPMGAGGYKPFSH
jgi:hypothetical protein